MKIAIVEPRRGRASAATCAFVVCGAFLGHTAPSAAQDKPAGAPVPVPIASGEQKSDKQDRDQKPAEPRRPRERPVEGVGHSQTITGADREPVFIDLDTHRWMTLPPDLRAAENKGKPIDRWVFPKPLQQWIERSGIDLAAQIDGRSLTVIGFDLRTGDSFPANDHKSEAAIAQSLAPAPADRSEWITLNLQLVWDTIYRRTPFVTREGGLGTFYFHVSGVPGPNTLTLRYTVARGPDIPKLTGHPLRSVYEPPILGRGASKLVVDVNDKKLWLRNADGPTQIELAADGVIVREGSRSELRAVRLQTGCFEIDATAGTVVVRGREGPTLRRMGDRIQIAYDKVVPGRYERNPDQRVAVTDQLTLSMPEGSVLKDALEWRTVKPSPEVLEKQADERRERDAAGAALYAELAIRHGYRLAPGQFIKRIAPPFPGPRDEYWRVTRPDQFFYLSPRGGAGPESVDYLWDGKALHEGTVSFSGARSLIAVCDTILKLKPQQISGPKSLLISPLLGDWVVRDQPITDDVFVAQLEPILRNELKLPIHLEFRDVPREVYVAHGTWHMTPLADTRVRTGGVQIYGKEMNSLRFGGGRGDFTRFLRAVGDWIDAPIVSDVVEPPKRVSWTVHGPGRNVREATAGERGVAHDPALVLQHVEAQTGLHFTKEKRPIKILFVEEKSL